MINETCCQNVRALVAAYRKATGLSVSQVSRQIYGNGHFLAAFLAGRQSMSLKKFDVVIGRFRSEWPPEAEWPMLRPAFIAKPSSESFPRKSSRPHVTGPRRIA